LPAVADTTGFTQASAWRHRLRISPNADFAGRITGFFDSRTVSTAPPWLHMDDYGHARTSPASSQQRHHVESRVPGNAPAVR